MQIIDIFGLPHVELEDYYRTGHPLLLYLYLCGACSSLVMVQSELFEP